MICYLPGMLSALGEENLPCEAKVLSSGSFTKWSSDFQDAGSEGPASVGERATPPSESSLHRISNEE